MIYSKRYTMEQVDNGKFIIFDGNQDMIHTYDESVANAVLLALTALDARIAALEEVIAPAIGAALEVK